MIINKYTQKSFEKQHSFTLFKFDSFVLGTDTLHLKLASSSNAVKKNLLVNYQISQFLIKFLEPRHRAHSVKIGDINVI